MGVLRGLPRRIARRSYRALFGPVEGGRRPVGVPDLALAVPFAYDLSDVEPPASPVAVVCHMFHADLAPEFRQLLEAMPVACDMFASTDTDAKRAAIEAAFAGWNKGRVDVRVAPNRGRDIAPKFITFRDVYTTHELVLFIHGKKSTTSDVGDRWRRTLSHSLAGSTAHILSILDIFARHPGIGVVMCQHFEPIRQHLHWDGSFRHAKALAARMGLKLTRAHVLELPSGSMFWARSAALRPLLDLALDLERDFPPEAGQLRSTNQHAIERLLLFVCELAGYDWTKVADPAWFEERSRIIPIRSRDQADVVIAASRLSLLGNGDAGGLAASWPPK